MAQLEVEDPPSTALPAALKSWQQELDRRAGHGPHRLRQSGEGRVGEAGPRRVVNRQESDVRRHFQMGVFQDLESTNSHQVVGHQ